MSDGSLVPWFQSMMGLRKSKTGITVGAYEALGIEIFYSCIRRIATDLSTIQIQVIRTNIRDGRVIHTSKPDHPAYTLINRVSSEADTSVTMWERVIAYALFLGRGAALIVRDKNSKPIELKYLKPSDYSEMVDVYGRPVYYVVNGVGNVMPDDMLVIRNFIGINPVTQFNDLLGLNISAEQYAAMYFANGGSTEGYIATPTNLSETQVVNVRDRWKNARTNGQTPVLEYGLEYKVVNGRPVDSELNVTRESTARRICAIFNVPPQFVQVESMYKYESVEALTKYYQAHVLRPWAKKIQAELSMKLLRYDERNSTYFEYDLDEINTAITSSRWDAYEKGLKNGVLSINDVREMEGLNPIEGGEINTVQVNQIALKYMEDYSKKITTEGPTTGAAANNNNQ
jgi:HK97 family phage portal protein